MSKYYIFDTETDGQDPQGLIQLSVCNQDNEVVFNEYLKPEGDIKAAALAVHGLTQNFLKDKMNVSPTYNYIHKEMAHSTDIFVAQNGQFDIDVINTFLEKNYGLPLPSEGSKVYSPGEKVKFQPKLLDTLRLAKHFIDPLEIGNFKLDTLFVFLFPKKVKQMFKRRNSHDAAEDCKMTNEVMIELGTRYMKTDNIQDIYEKSIKPYILTTWPMGKYKGQPLEDADYGYIRWAKSTLDDPDLKFSLELKGL
jgi:DNA polymerase III epsilon subunit-like protein